MLGTALEIDTPQLCATQLVANPGSLPTITIPVTSEALPDVECIWRYLREAADFFALPMPEPADLGVAIAGYAARMGVGPVAVNVTIAVAEGAPQVLVSGARMRRLRADAVHVSVDDSVPHAHRTTDPQWRRMSARTTSRGDMDQLERWLNGQGLADCISSGMPHLGALVFEVGSGEVVAVENPEPTSILDQLEQCGVITVIEHTSECPRDAQRAWWISPRYELHPVDTIDGTRLAVDAGVVPHFARWS